MHLALRLQQQDVDTTVYAEKGPDELRASRPVNIVGRFEQPCARERTLSVNHPANRTERIHCGKYSAERADDDCGPGSGCTAWATYRSLETVT